MLVIAVVGELDDAAGALLVDTAVAAFSAGEPQLLVDLRGVPALLPGQLSIFLGLFQSADEIGGRVGLVAGDAVARAFRDSWMDKFLPVHPDVAAAASAVRS